MNGETKLIFQVLNEILSNKVIIIEAESLMAPIPMPGGIKSNFEQKRSYEIHPGMDVGCPVGTKVSSMSDGTVETADFNLNKLCGATVDIMYDNGFWSRYCHLSKIDVKVGQRVVQGQVVGLSGGIEDSPGAGNSKGPHLHITLKKGGENGQKLNPVDYINKENSPVQGVYSGSTSATTNPLAAKTIDPNKSYYTPNLKDPNARYYQPNVQTEEYKILSEEKVYGSFGNNVQNRNYYLIIPKDSNSKIKSPVDGKIKKRGFSYGCKNQIDILHDIGGETFYLEYCGMKKVSSSGDVYKGSYIGETGDEDVQVTLYNSSNERVPIDYYKDKESSGKNQSGTRKREVIDPNKSYFPPDIKDVNARFYTPKEVDPNARYYKPKDIQNERSKFREDYKIQKNITKIRKLL